MGLALLAAVECRHFFFSSSPVIEALESSAPDVRASAIIAHLFLVVPLKTLIGELSLAYREMVVVVSLYRVPPFLASSAIGAFSWRLVYAVRPLQDCLVGKRTIIIKNKIP